MPKGDATWPTMTLDECLAFADEWSRGITLYPGAQGWRVVCTLLAEEVRAMRENGGPMKHAMICSYELPDDTSTVTLERCKQRDGGYKWAVRRGGACMNSDGEFEYEPMPSSRDDAFMARCRFGSAERAYAVWELAHNTGS